MVVTYDERCGKLHTECALLQNVVNPLISEACVNSSNMAQEPKSPDSHWKYLFVPLACSIPQKIEDISVNSFCGYGFLNC